LISEAVLAFTVTAVQASGSQDGGGIVAGERMETAALAVLFLLVEFPPLLTRLIVDYQPTSLTPFLSVN
jgi:hypothetical protein